MSKILYNVTVRISKEIESEWKDWMIQKHIPDVMATGHFLSYRMQRMIGDEADDGVTYAIGYIVKDMATLHQYQIQHAPALQKEHTDRYSGQFGAFRTLLEIVAEG